MPVKLSVSQVRKEVYHTAKACRENEGVARSTALLGIIFHNVFSSLLKDTHWQTLLADADATQEEWQKELTSYLYQKYVGPRLSKERARLIPYAAETLSFWHSSKEMCQWLGQIMWQLHKEQRTENKIDFKLLIDSEKPLAIRLNEKGWRDSVILTGIADLLVRTPDNALWCVVELKLGQSCAEADLAQAGLYHLILSAINKSPLSAMALIAFTPDKVERLFEANELIETQKKLRNLIGRLAGVLPDQAAIKPVSTSSIVVTKNEKISEQGKHLISIFQEYGKKIELAHDPIIGPTFVRYPIMLGKGVKLNAVQKIDQEIQHRMRLLTPPLIHMAEGSVVIDIQRPDRQTIFFDEISDQLPDWDPIIGCAKVIVGIDLNNQLRFADLAEPEHVHILVAGTSGSGKSECLRSALAGLLLTNTPDTLRLVLIDPKRNAFAELKNSPFLLNQEALVYPDEQSAENLLEELANEMDQRYRALQESSTDNRDQHVIKTGELMPRIICICDEYADLINRDKKARALIEKQIFRLGTKARAAGIHLIIATQQPSREVIRGALDANLPARIGLSMSKAIESNMLLNQKGAENLLGKGDLLFKDIGDPVRLQSPLLTTEKRTEIFTASR